MIPLPPWAKPNRDRKSKGSKLGPVILLWGLLLVPFGVYAHQTLTGSDPRAGAVLDAPPSELRLSFSEPIRLPLTSVELRGAEGGPIGLTQMRVSEASERVLVVGIEPLLEAGSYVVLWRTTGADGHATRGQFGFTVQIPVTQDSVRAVEPAEVDLLPLVGSSLEASSLEASSGIFVFTRWITLTALVLLLGALTLRWGVLPVAREHVPAVGESIDPVLQRAANVGVGASLVLLLLAPFRLFLQSAMVAGPPSDMNLDLVWIVATTGPWAAGWALQIVGSAVAIVGFGFARCGQHRGWVAACIAGIALTLFPAFSGHAVGGHAGHVLLHAVHVLVAGVWLGGLVLVVGVAIPVARRIERSIPALVGGFSVVATASVGGLFITGIVATFHLVGSIDALVTTEYGRTLMVKLGGVGGMALLGAYHALRLRHQLQNESAVQHLQKTGALEMAIGFLILLATAVLVGLPLPG